MILQSCPIYQLVRNQKPTHPVCTRHSSSLALCMLSPQREGEGQGERESREGEKERERGRERGKAPYPSSAVHDNIPVTNAAAPA